MAQKIRKAVFPVGGMGTRFLPATKAMPKEMLPIVDKPLIQYAVEEAAAAGIEEFIFVTGRGKSAIEDHFDRSFELEHFLRARGKTGAMEALDTVIKKPGRISYTRQMEPLGLGHAVWCARHLIGEEPFAVLLADDLIVSQTPCLKQMTDAYQEGIMVAVMDVPLEQVNRYGIVQPGETRGSLLEIQDVVEKPEIQKAPSTKAIIGRYLLPPDIFRILDRQEKGQGGEIQLTDALSRLRDRTSFRGYMFQGRRIDCGSKAGYLAANLIVGLQREDLRQEVLDELRENKDLLTTLAA